MLACRSLRGSIFARTRWGRDIIVADRTTRSAAGPSYTRFNGAATSSSRIGRRGQLVDAGRDASMGPRHHRRGSTLIVDLPPPAKLLQWGRDIIVADRPWVRPDGRRWSGFNGPATSSSRIVGSSTVTLEIDTTLQWGRDIIVADCALGAELNVWRFEQLQWGRDIIVADCACVPSREAIDAFLASMGPRHHRRGLLPLRGHGCVVSELLQWGRDIIVAD